MSLSESQVADFHDQGYLRLEGVLDPEEDLRPVIKAYEGVIEERAQQRHAAGRLSSLYADEPFDRRIASIAAEAPEVGQDELGKQRHVFGNSLDIFGHLPGAPPGDVPVPA